jgi:hypothetical protein
MSDSIRIDVARDTDRADLAAFLRGRGFLVTPVATAGPATLVVTRPSASAERLDDPWQAVRTWLGTSEAPLVPIVLREDEYALAPPSD